MNFENLLNNKMDESSEKFGIERDLDKRQYADQSMLQELKEVVPDYILDSILSMSGSTIKNVYNFYQKYPEFKNLDISDFSKYKKFIETFEKFLNNNNYSYRVTRELSENIAEGDQGSTTTGVTEILPGQKQPSSDYAELSEEELSNLKHPIDLESAVKIVNKWLCKALDRNDGKAIREACIVLKAMEVNKKL